MPLPAIAVGITVAVAVVLIALKPFGPDQLYDVIAPIPDAPIPVKVKLLPRQRERGDAVMLATVGFAFTVTLTTELHPPDTVYVIFAVPDTLPVTFPVVPVALVTVKFVLLLVHVPPLTEFEIVAVPPKQSAVTPVLAGGLVQGGK